MRVRATGIGLTREPFSSSARSLSFISPAAFSVKVTATMSSSVPRAAPRIDGHDPADQLGGLPRSRGCLDEERLVQTLAAMAARSSCIWRVGRRCLAASYEFGPGRVESPEIR